MIVQNSKELIEKNLFCKDKTQNYQMEKALNSQLWTLLKKSMKNLAPVKN